jgi:hypothetical protein
LVGNEACHGVAAGEAGLIRYEDGVSNYALASQASFLLKDENEACHGVAAGDLSRRSCEAAKPEAGQDDNYSDLEVQQVTLGTLSTTLRWKKVRRPRTMSPLGKGPAR